MKISELEKLLGLIRKGHGDIDIVFSRADSEVGCCINCGLEVELDSKKNSLVLTIM